MPVKLIENAQKKHPSETGVKIIKNVTPNQGLMVLYREPKRVNVRRWFKKAFTWDVEVWVARAQFDMPENATQNNLGISNSSYACVKEKKTNLWVSNNAIHRQPNQAFFSIDEMIKVTPVPAKVIPGPPLKCTNGRNEIPCPPGAGKGDITIEAHNKITFNVSLRRGDIYSTLTRDNDFDVQTTPRDTDPNTLLKIYNVHNTKNETIIKNVNDEFSF